jgi:hypothetical protein
MVLAGADATTFWASNWRFRKWDRVFTARAKYKPFSSRRDVSAASQHSWDELKKEQYRENQ